MRLRHNLTYRVLQYALVMALVFLAGDAVGQQAADLAVQAQNPAPVNTLEVEGGYGTDFRADGSNESYYRISYLGSLVKSQGTPFKYAKGLDLAIPAPTTGAGDQRQITLRYERGTLGADGGLFEAQGVRPLTLRGFEKLDLRGTAFVGGDADGKQIELAVGLESPPLRLPGFQHSQASNWIVFGINAQRQEDTDSQGNDEDFGLATYRAFLGKAFGWGKSADVSETAGLIAEQFLGQAPTYEDALQLAERIRAIPANQRTALQQLFLDSVVEAEDQANWVRTVRDMALGHADAVTDQPTVAVYFESSGYYAFSGGIEGSRFKNLLTGTIDYWFLPDRDDVFLRIRYENGYERAVPTERKDRLLLSAVLRI